MAANLRRILLVDGCAEDRAFAKQLLTNATDCDWQFAESSDGGSGLALAVSSGPFDCILVDYHLPDMDGTQFLQLLPKLFGEPGVAVVMLAGSGNESLAVRAMKAGAQDYLSKRDLNSKLLCRAVEYSIHRFHLILANRQPAKALQDANHDLETFSYSVSHDLRAPLRRIGGFSRMLIDDFGAGMPLQAQQHLQRIEDGVAHMALLIDGLLRLAQLGRQALKLRHTVLTPIVEGIISVLQPECEGREIEWRIGCLPTLTCDRALITQVFQNLIGNAIKYSRSQAKTLIEIGSIEEQGKPSVIFVCDNGVGFDMKYAERLFGVFQRMHQESEFEGCGIGLATVERIISRHNGRVWAEAAVGAGATFYFTLADRALPLRVD